MSVPEPQPKPRAFGKAFWKVLLIAVVLVFALFAADTLFSDCNGIKQKYRLEKARQHIAAISPTFFSKPGRENVELFDFTGGPCGAIQVRGVCASSEEANAIRAEIEASKPPIEVLFQLSIPMNGYEVHIDVSPLPASK